MTPIECLRKHREAPAEFVAEQTGLPLEQVYAELVKAESAGLVRVVCGHAGIYRAWEAL